MNAAGFFVSLMHLYNKVNNSPVVVYTYFMFLHHDNYICCKLATHFTICFVYNLVLQQSKQLTCCGIHIVLHDNYICCNLAAHSTIHFVYNLVLPVFEQHVVLNIYVLHNMRLH